MGITERKEREKEHRREEILDAAQKVFFQKGLAAATVDEIAETAELSKGTLYLYYKSKEDMYLAVMMRGMAGLHDEFERIGTSAVSSVQKIINLGEAYKKHFRTHRKIFQMIHYSQVPQIHKQVSDEMQKSCEADSQKTWNIINSILKRAVEEGVLSPELNPVEIGIILWSNMTTLLFHIDTDNTKWKSRFNIDLEHVLELSNSLLFESILTEKGRAEFKTLRRTKLK